VASKEHKVREARLRWLVISRERIQSHLQRGESVALRALSGIEEGKEEFE